VPRAKEVKRRLRFTPDARGRVVLVVAQAATLLLTWRLWEVRTSPPLLPYIALPQLSVGVPLLLSLVLVVWDRRAVYLHAGLLVAALLMDQTRIQPGPISLCLLLVATLPRLRALAPAHLAALWIWGGVHKLLSPDFAILVAPGIFGSRELGLFVAAVEIALGALIFLRRRRELGMVALALHGTASVVLLWRGEYALLPWNVVLAGVYFFIPNERSRILDAVPFLIPAGFYLGIVDAYFAHVLFTGGVTQSVRCDAQECRSDVEQDEVRQALGVPLGPEDRLIRTYFRATCYPGEELFVTLPQTYLHPRRQSLSEPCPDLSP
jgi:hypothetical protein